METCVWCFINNILESIIFSLCSHLEAAAKICSAQNKQKTKHQYKMIIMIRDFSQYISTNHI